MGTAEFDFNGKGRGRQGTSGAPAGPDVDHSGKVKPADLGAPVPQLASFDFNGKSKSLEPKNSASPAVADAAAQLAPFDFNGKSKSVEPKPSEPAQAAEPAPEAAAPEKRARVAAPAPNGAMYTMLAREGVNAAGLINAALAKTQVGKAPARQLVVQAPNGPSTSGGKKARQAITLAPVSGDGAAVMCGWIDIAQKNAEIRAFEGVQDQFKKRFGMPLDVTREEYAGVVEALKKMLVMLQFSIDEEQVEVEAADEQGARPATTPLTYAIFAVSLAAAIVTALVVLLR